MKTEKCEVPGCANEATKFVGIMTAGGFEKHHCCASHFKDAAFQLAYEKKFAGFIRALADAKDNIDVIAIHHPEVLGDTYDELVESLNRWSETDVQLKIVPRSERGKK